MQTATFVKRLTESFTGDARLYKLSQPIEYQDWDSEKEDYVTKSSEYVVVSAASVPFSGPETYMFPSDSEGHITDWGEIGASQKGHVSHETVLQESGYEMAA